MKKKIILGTVIATILPNAVLADKGYGMMGGSWMMGYFGFGLLWLVYLALGSLIFSAIFWGMYNVIVKDKKRRRK